MVTPFNKPIVMTLFLFLLGLCNACLVIAENQKSTYIVHVDKSKMPASFEHHSVWYESSLNSISDSAEIIYTYDNAIHGFSTRLTAEEARSLESQTGILAVLRSKIYKLQTTRTPQFLGIDKITEQFPNSNTNSDVVIGLLDTGVWPESKSFDDTGLGPIPSTWKGQCETGTNFTTTNCNKKLIGARFFKQSIESSKGAINEAKEFRSPRDSDGHGTHTASTAAGSAVEGANIFGFANGTARGMATRARVAVYKVCWGEACDSADILAAIDKAISDNVNVLSMSLGGVALDYDDDNIAIGSFSAMEKGIFVSMAGGNDGPIPAGVSNIAPWITTVGAGTLDRDFPAYVNLGNGRKYLGTSLYNGKSLPNGPIPFIYAGNAGNGTFSGNFCVDGTLAPEKVAKKVVLCERGMNARVEKGFVVKAAGGLGMVLANPEGSGEELVADPHILPALAVGAKAGEAMKKYISSDPNPTVKFVFKGTKLGVQPSPVVATFSARGPNPITPEILKPDIIAPGVNILAAWSRESSPSTLEEDKRRVDFNIISGTSMSCPHLSGIAALVKSFHQDWSPAMIRSALMTTAYTTYKNGNTLLDSYTEKPATPLDFGAGHVNAVAALNPGLVYDLTVDDYLGFLCALNYTSDQIKTVTRKGFKCDSRKHYSLKDFNYPSFVAVFNSTGGSSVQKHTRTLTNVGAAGTYKALVTSDTPSVKISVEPEVLSFNANEKKSYALTFTFTTSGNIKPGKRDYGFGRLQWSDGKNVVGSPILFKWE